MATFYVIKIDATDNNLSRIWSSFLGNHLQESRLTGTGFTNQKNKFISTNMQGNIIENSAGALTVALGDMVE